MLKSTLAVMLGGAIGSGLRWWLSGWCAVKYGVAFPIGTLVVNVLGCFVIGLFAALTATDGGLSASTLARQLVMAGVLGGFTTFSAFSLQTMELFQAGHAGRALANVALSLLLCLAATWLGHWLAGLLKG
jgi:CrcB protein